MENLRAGFSFALLGSPSPGDAGSERETIPQTRVCGFHTESRFPRPVGARTKERALRWKSPPGRMAISGVGILEVSSNGATSMPPIVPLMPCCIIRASSATWGCTKHSPECFIQQLRKVSSELVEQLYIILGGGRKDCEPTSTIIHLSLGLARGFGPNAIYNRGQPTLHTMSS